MPLVGRRNQVPRSEFPVLFQRLGMFGDHLRNLRYVKKLCKPFQSNARLRALQRDEISIEA
jgi:hypothetical protein